MWLVICSPEDGSALWAGEGLKRRGLEPLHILDSASLAQGVGWEHHVQDEAVWTEITLPGGKEVRSSDVRGVLNRMTAVWPASLLLVQPADRYYVTHELQAFFLSWLNALTAPVLNRPSAFGLSGRLRHVSEWVWLASKAGLPNRGYRQSSQERPLEWGSHVRLADAGTPSTLMLVAGESVTGPPAPAHIRDGCRRLSELSGATLLGIEFEVDDDQTWIFAGASTSPDLRLGGEMLLDSLAQALNGRSP